jgi:hypothetical protein
LGNEEIGVSIKKKNKDMIQVTVLRGETILYTEDMYEEGLLMQLGLIDMAQFFKNVIDSGFEYLVTPDGGFIISNGFGKSKVEGTVVMDVDDEDEVKRKGIDDYLRSGFKRKSVRCFSCGSTEHLCLECDEISDEDKLMRLYMIVRLRELMKKVCLGVTRGCFNAPHETPGNLYNSVYFKKLTSEAQDQIKAQLKPITLLNRNCDSVVHCINLGEPNFKTITISEIHTLVEGLNILDEGGLAGLDTLLSMLGRHNDTLK